jgi:hypothetical protein
VSPIVEYHFGGIEYFMLLDKLIDPLKYIEKGALSVPKDFK